MSGLVSSNSQSKTPIKSKSAQQQAHFIGDFETAPSFMKDNEGITHGYRINFNDSKKIFKSLFMVHNESVNIWSHCLPAIAIIVFLCSFLVLIDGEAIRNSMHECQGHIQKGVDHYMHALDNLSLITQYDTFTKYTQDQMHQLKQTVLSNYQEFTNKFTESSNHFQNLLGRVQDFKSNVKQTFKANLGKFQKAKIQFQKKIAPMLISEFKGKVDGVWVKQLKDAIESLKNVIDSDDFQYLELHDKIENPNQISRWPIVVYLISAAICLLSSTLFHLFYPMSSKIYTLTNRFDYAGINLLIAGSQLSPIYYGLYCKMEAVTIYLTIAIVMGIFCFIVCLFQWIHRVQNTKYKAFLLATYGASQIIPITHLFVNNLLFNDGDTYSLSTSFPYIILMGCSYIGGLYIYTIRCPQRNNPGKYNICGHSHQFLHGAAILGIIFNYLAALQSFEMRKISVCPA